MMSKRLAVQSNVKIPVPLTGSEQRVFEEFNFIDVDMLNTTADITKVYIRVNGEGMPSRLLDIAGSYIADGQFLSITWDPSETGKQVTLVLGKESMYFGYRALMSLLNTIYSHIRKNAVTVVVYNGQDQPVNVQLIGCIDSVCTYSVNIGSAFIVNSKQTVAKTLTPDTSGWMPYLTASLQNTATPTIGAVLVEVIRTATDYQYITYSFAMWDTNVHNYKTDPNYILIVPW